MSPLNDDMDANRWVAEFLKTVEKQRWAMDPAIDVDFLRAWFANAIMCGFDHGSRRQTERIEELEEQVEVIKHDTPFFEENVQLCEENARLREALEKIAILADDTDSTGTEQCVVLWAREALRARRDYTPTIEKQGSTIERPVQAKHFAMTAFVAVCGADEPNQQTTKIGSNATCPDCIQWTKQAESVCAHGKTPPCCGFRPEGQ